MSQPSEIHKAIERLHERESGDYESLLRQIGKRQRRVELNIPQMLASLASTDLLALEWGRGTGKTTQRGSRYSTILRTL
ncbi:MAG: hypothetical protein AAFY91_07885, partial [Bacteroidota bacterium]